MIPWLKELEIENIKQSDWFPKDLDIDLNDDSIFRFFKIVNNYINMSELC